MRQACPIRRVAFISSLAAAFAGCSGLQRPYDFWNPGDARYQRSVAVAHDPYPLNDLGPPIDGGRPRGFQKPLTEVQRSQLYNPPQRPLRPLPTVQPAVVTPGPMQPLTPSPWPPAASAPLPLTTAPVQTVPLPSTTAPGRTVPAPYSSAPPVQPYPPPPTASNAPPQTVAPAYSSVPPAYQTVSPQ